MSDEYYFDKRTQCFLNAIEYDFNDRSGKLIMGYGSCTDMTGCIKIFKAIDKRVQLIMTYTRSMKDHTYKPDTAYRLVNKEWQALVHREGR